MKDESAEKQIWGGKDKELRPERRMLRKIFDVTFKE
jgi:hypothetical protein